MTGSVIRSIRDEHEAFLLALAARAAKVRPASAYNPRIRPSFEGRDAGGWAHQGVKRGG
jgi:hypothetical protein